MRKNRFLLLLCGFVGCLFPNLLQATPYNIAPLASVTASSVLDEEHAASLVTHQQIRIQGTAG